MKECEMKIPTSHSKNKKKSERRGNSAKVPIKRKEEKKFNPQFHNDDDDHHQCTFVKLLKRTNTRHSVPQHFN